MTDTNGDADLASYSPYVSLIPARGYHLQLKDGNRFPILGWAMQEDGSVYPLVFTGAHAVVLDDEQEWGERIVGAQIKSGEVK